MELRKKAANMNAGGEERRLPKNRAALYVFLIWTNIMDIFAANLLFLLFSIPVVTAPAALCALSRVMTVMIRNGACPVWREFIREFKESFWKGMALGAVWAAWMAASYGAGRLGAPFAAAMLPALLGTVSACYAFPMAAGFVLRIRDIIKNSLLLLCGSPGNTLVLMLLCLLLYFIVAVLLPPSLPLMLLAGASAWQLAVCITVKPAFEKYLMREKEKEQMTPDIRS